jgi:hypothetical protein
MQAFEENITFEIFATIRVLQKPKMDATHS